MKLVLIDMFKSASGKVCQDSEFYTATRNGKTYTGRICHPSKSGPTPEQAAMREKFKKVSADVMMIINSGPGNDLYDSYASQYHNHKLEYATLRGYIFAELWKK
ncbi:MAG: hypothetical protein MJZ15_08955 [Bacteroidales bacterium]|nr:hypothetical protein [Bacteroidales bacterium]